MLQKAWEAPKQTDAMVTGPATTRLKRISPLRIVPSILFGCPVRFITHFPPPSAGATRVIVFDRPPQVVEGSESALMELIMRLANPAGPSKTY
jgi:hypothetical protein